MGGVRLSNKFSYFYIFRDTFFGFGFLPFVFLLYFFAPCLSDVPLWWSFCAASHSGSKSRFHGSWILNPGSQILLRCRTLFIVQRPTGRGRLQNIAPVGPNHVTIVALSTIIQRTTHFSFFPHIFWANKMQFVLWKKQQGEEIHGWRQSIYFLLRIYGKFIAIAKKM